MVRATKNSQLQLRISARQKVMIRQAAKEAGLDLSSYVLSRVLPPHGEEFQRHIAAIRAPAGATFALAELNSFLSKLIAGELSDAVARAPEVELTPFLANYVAAMVEYACGKKEVPAPLWTRAVAPLTEPVMGTTLESLRLYLLTHSPPPFRRRNIFIDSSVGSRV